jgi:hypothetical protein
MHGPRSLTLLLVVATVALAGCQVAPTGGDATPTRYASGDDLDGEQLQSDHDAVVNASGNYTTKATMTFRRTDVDGATERRITERILADEDRDTYLITNVQAVGGETTERAIYQSGDLRLVRANGEIASVGAREPPRPLSAASTLYKGSIANFVGDATWTVADMEVRGERAITTYELTAVDDTAYVTAFGDVNAETASTVEATLVVDDRGLVRSFETSFDTTAPNGQEFAASLSFETRAVGNTTVDRPAWVDDG